MKIRVYEKCPVCNKDVYGTGEQKWKRDTILDVFVTHGLEALDDVNEIRTLLLNLPESFWETIHPKCLALFAIDRIVAIYEKRIKELSDKNE